MVPPPLCRHWLLLIRQRRGSRQHCKTTIHSNCCKSSKCLLNRLTSAGSPLLVRRMNATSGGLGWSFTRRHPLTSPSATLDCSPLQQTHIQYLHQQLATHQGSHPHKIVPLHLHLHYYQSLRNSPATPNSQICTPGRLTSPGSLAQRHGGMNSPVHSSHMHVARMFSTVSMQAPVHANQDK